MLSSLGLVGLLLLLPLLATAHASAGLNDTREHELTLADFIRPGENLALYDSLSLLIKADIESQPISSDFVEPAEPNINRSFSFSKLNAKYDNFLLEHDIRPDKELLNEMLQDLSNFKRDKRQALRKKSYPREIWKDGVPVAFHRSMNKYKRATVLASIKFFSRETCIRFRPKKKEQVYLYFVGHDAGCWSTVGRDPAQRQQWLSIGDGCEPFGIASHEVAHALGLFHEQSRYDRDKHIQVLADRIPSAIFYNFGKVSKRVLSTYKIPYEIGSVMHYGPTEFSKQQNVPSIVAKDPNFQYTMGSLTGPTFLDVQLLNSHYKCGSQCKLKAKCFNGGYNDPNRCGHCKCPEGFSGRQCLKPELPSLRGCGGLVRATKSPRKIRIHIKKAAGKASLRKCVYHLAAPRGQRLQIRLSKLSGTICETGCWRQAIELKPMLDKRLTGYRFCCPGYASRRIISANHFVPLTLFSRGGETQAELSFQIYQPEQRDSLNNFTLPKDVDTASLSDYLRNENININSHDTELEDLPELIEDHTFEPEVTTAGSNFETIVSTGTPTGNLIRSDEEEPTILTNYPLQADDVHSFLNPADIPTQDEIENTYAMEEPIDLTAFDNGQNPVYEQASFSNINRELRS